MTTTEDQALVAAVNDARKHPRPWRATEPALGIVGEPHAVYVLEDADGQELMLLIQARSASAAEHQALVAELVRSVNSAPTRKKKS